MQTERQWSWREKVRSSSYLLAEVFRRAGVRLRHILRHFLQLPAYLASPILSGIRLHFLGRVLLWWAELFFLFLDLLGVPEWYEIGSLWLKPASRPLDVLEWDIAYELFAGQLPYRRIRIDERAYIGPRQYRFCYVSFCVINSWEAMTDAVLVHELVHVWQFQRYGSPYILRALLAQRSMAGYDYGGLDGLRSAKSASRGLDAFNYEQQASIIEDYFLLSRTGHTRRSRANLRSDLDIYQYFVAALTNSHL